MAISFVNQGSAASTTLTLPTGIATGDLIVMFALNASTSTVPTVPSGWTQIPGGSSLAASGIAFVAAYRIATGTDTVGTWTNATLLQTVVYRGAKIFGGLEAQISNSNSIGTQFYGLINPDGSSVSLNYIASKQVVSESTPAGMTLRGTATAASTCMSIVFDQTVAAGTNNVSSGTSTLGAVALCVAFGVELTDSTKILSRTVYTASSTWTSDAGANGAVALVWGAGGSGAATTGGAGGGGGGAFARKIVTGLAGSTGYTVTVGSGGASVAAGGTTAGNNGGDSWFKTNTTVLAKGGSGGASNGTGGAGGTTAASIGDTVFQGGTAGSDISGSGAGGGGGGGAGTHGNGNSGGAASGSTGGSGGAPGTELGGYGGNGAGTGTAQAGSAVGGGGGGKGSLSAAASGAGATGQVIVYGYATSTYAVAAAISGAGSMSAGMIADRYWVGGTGNWSDTAHWAATSGGAGGASIPDIYTNVHFDANSFTATGQTVSLTATAAARSINWTGATFSPTWNPATNIINIYGSLTLIASMQLQTAAEWDFRGSGSASPITITTAGQPLLCRYLQLLNGTGFTDSVFNLADDLVTYDPAADWGDGNFYITGGAQTLNTNNHNITSGAAASWGAFYVDDTVTLNLGTSTITATGDVDLGYNTYTNPTKLSAANATLVMTPSTYIGSRYLFLAAAQTFGNVNISGTMAFDQSNSRINALTIQPGAQIKSQGSGGTYTNITTSFTAVGTAGSPIILTDASGTTQYGFVMAGTGTVNARYLQITNSIVSGGAAWTAYDSVNNGNNTGWTFAQTITAAMAGSGTIAAAPADTEALGAGMAGGGAMNAAVGNTALIASGMAGTGSMNDQIADKEPMGAAMSGAGSMVAAPIIPVLIQAAITGAGSMTAAPADTELEGSAMSGAGSMTAAIIDKEPVAAGMTGAGAMVAAVKNTDTMAAALAGAGSMTANETNATTVAANVSGSGSMSPTVKDATTSAAVMAGSGSMGAAVTNTALIASGMAGTGSMVASTQDTDPMSTAMSGAGSMSAAPIDKTTVASAMAGGSGMSTLLQAATTIAASLSGSSSGAATLGDKTTVAASMAGSGAMSSTVADKELLQAGMSGSGAMNAGITNLEKILAAITAGGTMGAAVANLTTATASMQAGGSMTAAPILIIPLSAVAMNGAGDIVSSLNVDNPNAFSEHRQSVNLREIPHPVSLCMEGHSAVLQDKAQTVYVKQL